MDSRGFSLPYTILVIGFVSQVSLYLLSQSEHSVQVADDFAAWAEIETFGLKVEELAISLIETRSTLDGLQWELDRWQRSLPTLAAEVSTENLCGRFNFRWLERDLEGAAEFRVFSSILEDSGFQNPPGSNFPQRVAAEIQTNLGLLLKEGIQLPTALLPSFSPTLGKTNENSIRQFSENISILPSKSLLDVNSATALVLNIIFPPDVALRLETERAVKTFVSYADLSERAFEGRPINLLEGFPITKLGFDCDWHSAVFLIQSRTLAVDWFAVFGNADVNGTKVLFRAVK